MDDARHRLAALETWKVYRRWAVASAAMKRARDRSRCVDRAGRRRPPLPNGAELRAGGKSIPARAPGRAGVRA